MLRQSALFVVEHDPKGNLIGNLRTVAVGATVDGDIVIEKGVASGDTVVTDGQLLLAPGSKVEIKKGG